jgi:magnesium transporter
MAELQIESILPDIESLIDEQQEGALLHIISDLHPTDIEDILNRLKSEKRRYIFNLLPANLASEVLRELDDPVAEDVLHEASDERITSIIHEMDSDDAADIVAELPEDVQERVLETLTAEASEEVKELLEYKEDTAGGIMALEVLSMEESATVNETIEKIREMREEIDNIYNVWVINGKGIYLGNVSLTDLVLARGNAKLSSVMEVNELTININQDQEEVANFFKKYDMVSAPVVDNNGKLVGRITFDDIVDVIEEEGSEDMARISGAPDEELQEVSAFKISRARIPWLLVAFVGEIFAAYIVNLFALELSQQIVIALFIPVIMAMGGASGQQASVTVVRGLATGDIDIRDTWSRLIKEFRVSIMNSFFFASLLSVIVYIWFGPLFSIILGGSMFIIINNATILGALVPMMFKRLNIDPALAAAPLVSTSNDILGLLIYLSITTFVLSVGM